jgi:hypothetical protein
MILVPFFRFEVPNRGYGRCRNFKSAALVSHILPINHESRRVDASLVGVVFMKKLAVTAVALIALLAVSGCAGIGKGKGKAPPPIPAPPVMTKG